MNRFKLEANQLKKYWDSSMLDFDNISKSEPYCGIIGQEKAIKAMKFGVSIKEKGYNVYICGINGTGRTTYAREYLKQVASDEKTPDDWCYVYNFESPSQPMAINLPSGRGCEFRDDIYELIALLRSEIDKAFSGETYENERALIYQELQDKRNELIDDFNRYADENNFKVGTTKEGIFFTPVVDGEPIGEEEYEQLDEETKEKIKESLSNMQLQAMEYLRKMKELEEAAKQKAKKLRDRIALLSIELHIDDVKAKYDEFPKVKKYLDDLKSDILGNISDFQKSKSDQTDDILSKIFGEDGAKVNSKYSVNLFIDNSDVKGAPVIAEYNPTYNDLFGKLEYENRFGTLVTDFTMIKPGAIQRANNGYLILQASDVFSTPYMWEGLKKVIKTGSLSIENLREQLGLMSISTLKPEAIPIDIKIVLIGSEYIYHLVYLYDEEFSELFKIRVDFDDEMEANYDNLKCVAKFIDKFRRDKGCLDFTVDSVVAVAEYSARLVGDQNKLSTRFNEIADILIEADAWARMEKKELITSREIKKAIKEKARRSSKYDQKLLDMLQDGTIMIDTEGAVVGQINGLAIVNMGDAIFGKPSKITATTYMGRSGIINIEREVDMSGTTHNKGVMILSSYIGDKYAQDIPLTLSASVTFEQLYGGIDGDSASSTELYAILSSLAEVPIKQGIAVTGSINQKGEIQPVGNVTHKIEGFYELCKHRGFTGDQGVIIPYQNIKNLCLRDEVINDVDRGLFHIYAISNVDDGIEILTGIPAGKRLKDGQFEENTIHEKVYNKLKTYALTMIQFGKDDKR